MEEKNQQPIEALQDIKRIMERSSRFISLSGLSGIAAGTCALVGAWMGCKILKGYYGGYNSQGIFSGDDFSRLKIKLAGLAVAIFLAAFVSSFYLTWRRTK